MKKESYTKAKLCYIDKDSLKIQNKTRYFKKCRKKDLITKFDDLY